MFDNLTARLSAASALVAFAVAGVFATLVLAVGDLRGSSEAARHSEELVSRVTELEALAVDVQTANRGFLISRNESFLDPLRGATRMLPARSRELRAAVRDDTIRADVDLLLYRVDRYVYGYSVPLAKLSRTDRRSALASVAAGQGKRRLDGVRRVAARALATERREAAARAIEAESSSARAVFFAEAGLLLSAGLLIGFGVYVARAITMPVRRVADAASRLAGGDHTVRLRVRGTTEVAELGRAFNHMATALDDGRRELESRNLELEEGRGAREAQIEFGEAMQLAGGEREAGDVVVRHLERTLLASTVMVLRRNDEGSMEAATPAPSGSPLAQRLTDEGLATGCVAARYVRTHREHADRERLVSCRVCGRLATESICTPVTAAGEVLGAVLVLSRDGLSEEGPARVAESVSQAAPVLANLRNLAQAEGRAATDALTGLPNRGTLDEDVRRLVAQAGRTQEPLAAVLIDIDHFKNVNDTHGHGSGDIVLRSVARALRAGLRESDRVGRYGGEEFLALLPATDAAGAAAAAETLRAAVAGLRVPGIDTALTASFGVAAYPAHALDHERLLERADGALYRAKGAGRDRVEVAAGDGAGERFAALDPAAAGRVSPGSQPPA